MPPKIIAFSKHLLAVRGGAEAGTLRFIRGRAEKTGYAVALVSGVPDRGEYSGRPDIPGAWEQTVLTSPFRLPLFNYFDYFLNRPYLRRFFSSFSREDELYAFGIWAPAALSAFPGRTTCLIHAETDLGVDRNYYSGIKRVLRAFSAGLEFPFRRTHRRELQAAVSRAGSVIANSQFTADCCVACLGRKPDAVIHPVPDAGVLLASYRTAVQARAEGRPGIVFVDGSEAKGLGLVRALAHRLPAEPFIIFSPSVAAVRVEGNVTWRPWTENQGEIYARAKLVIVPSVCREGFGLVAWEARQLGIPVLVSAHGGLPESVDFDASSQVRDFHSVSAWEAAIRKSTCPDR